MFLESNLVTNRKKNALKVLTNTVQQSTKKSGGNNLKQLKVLPMKNFETSDKCKSPLQDNVYNEDEVNHFDCGTFEKGKFGN